MILIEEKRDQTGTAWDNALLTRIIYEADVLECYVHAFCAEEQHTPDRRYEAAVLVDNDPDHYDCECCGICGIRFNAVVLDYIPTPEPKQREPNPFNEHFL